MRCVALLKPCPFARAQDGGDNAWKMVCYKGIALDVLRNAPYHETVALAAGASLTEQAHFVDVCVNTFVDMPLSRLLTAQVPRAVAPPRLDWCMGQVTPR